MAKKKTPKEVIEELSVTTALRTPDYAMGLSTGSTLLDLACTGRVGCGYIPGNYYFFVGDSDSGKSMASMTSLAEAANDPRYDAYQLISDNPEKGVQMDVAAHFGAKLAERMRPPCYRGKDRDTPWYSETVEDFYLHLDDALRRGPTFYVLDSMDCLSSQTEDRQFTQMRRDTRKAQKADDEGGDAPKEKGNYGDGKAKKNSQYLRQMLPRIDDTGSILLIIEQTRDDLRSPYGGKTHSGGHAVAFYAQVRVWSKVVSKITKDVRGKERHVGNLCEFHVRRSRFTGREARVRVPILFSTGIDDVGGCVDYLVEEQEWTKSGGVIRADEFDFRGTRSELIAHIEGASLEPKLRETVGRVWSEVAQEMRVERKKRYE